MDHQAFEFATRRYFLYGKQCYHITNKNKSIAYYENNQAYILFILCHFPMKVALVY